MQSLMCPIPTNINPLQSNGFIFSVQKLPEISFFCQEANIPSIVLGAPLMATPLVDTPIPGEKLEFGDLNVTFMINETMDNYIAIYTWLIGLGFPKNHQQFQTFINSRTNSLNPSFLIAGYSDATLQILNSSNNPSRTIFFEDVFPVSLEQIQLQSTTGDTTYLAGSATFKYTLYRFE